MYDWWICFWPDGDPGGTSGSGDDPPPDPDPDPDGSEDKDSPEGDEQVPKAELAKANREAGKYRKQLRDAEARITALEGEKKSELEKAMDKGKEAETEAEKLAVKNAALRVRIAAEEVGIVREARADAASLLDWEKIENPDDDKQLVAALKDLVKEKPYLLGSGSGADGGAGGNGKSADGKDMNSLIRGSAGR